VTIIITWGATMISSFVSPALLDVQLEAVLNGVQEVTMLKKL
jgi:hypothetical protein